MTEHGEGGWRWPRVLAVGCAALGCAGLVALALFVLGVGWLGVAAVDSVEAAQAFGEVEQRNWPRNTPRRALATRSPSGRFSTRAEYGGSEEDLAGTDYLYVEARGCSAEVQLTEQPHAGCLETPLACAPSDGRRLHERYGMRVRWLDDARLAISWTELLSADEEGHRTWTSARQVYRVRLRLGPSELSACDDFDGWCERCEDGRVLEITTLD